MRHAKHVSITVPAKPDVVGIHGVEAPPNGPAPMVPAGFVHPTASEVSRMKKLVAEQRGVAAALADELEAISEGEYVALVTRRAPDRAEFVAALRLALKWEASAVSHEAFARYARANATICWDALKRIASRFISGFRSALLDDPQVAIAWPAAERFCRVRQEMGVRGASTRMKNKADREELAKALAGASKNSDGASRDEPVSSERAGGT